LPNFDGQRVIKYFSQPRRLLERQPTYNVFERPPLQLLAHRTVCGHPGADRVIDLGCGVFSHAEKASENSDRFGSLIAKKKKSFQGRPDKSF
jgi:hypothetical protein